MLLAEDGNPHDPSAVSVWIDGLLVGYLPRDQASAVRPGLLAAQEREGKPIALEGVIVKGAMRGDGGGRLSVVLRYDPEESVADQMGWTGTDSWNRGGNTTDYQPAPRLPGTAALPTGWRLVTGAARCRS
jgi:hypothetical protein